MTVIPSYSVGTVSVAPVASARRPISSKKSKARIALYLSANTMKNNALETVASQTIESQNKKFARSISASALDGGKR
jgi:hypothetical protein